MVPVLFEKAYRPCRTLRVPLSVSALLIALLTVVPNAGAQVTTTVTPSIQGDATVAELRGRAERGDIDAQVALAMAYRYGMGIRIDKAQAMACTAKPPKRDTSARRRRSGWRTGAATAFLRTIRKR